MFILVDKLGEEKTICELNPPGYKSATNNQMELRACILALEEASKMECLITISKVVIHTDSMYVVRNYPVAMFQWQKNRWLSKSGRPILNAELWKDLIKIRKKIWKNVEIKWVKGHSKNLYNRAVDKLAKNSAKNATNKPLSTLEIRRKKSARSVEPGCVKMLGQRLSIHIITSEYLRTHKLYKYRYEVISKNSPYYHFVDFIFSDFEFKTGHIYYIVMNKELNNPRINKIIREIILSKKSKIKDPKTNDETIEIQAVNVKINSAIITNHGDKNG